MSCGASDTVFVICFDAMHQDQHLLVAKTSNSTSHSDTTAAVHDQTCGPVGMDLLIAGTACYPPAVLDTLPASASNYAAMADVPLQLNHKAYLSDQSSASLHQQQSMLQGQQDIKLLINYTSDPLQPLQVHVTAVDIITASATYTTRPQALQLGAATSGTGASPNEAVVLQIMLQTAPSGPLTARLVVAPPSKSAQPVAAHVSHDPAGSRTHLPGQTGATAQQRTLPQPACSTADTSKLSSSSSAALQHDLVNHPTGLLVSQLSTDAPIFVPGGVSTSQHRPLQLTALANKPESSSSSSSAAKGPAGGPFHAAAEPPLLPGGYQLLQATVQRRPLEIKVPASKMSNTSCSTSSAALGPAKVLQRATTAPTRQVPYHATPFAAQRRPLEIRDPLHRTDSAPVSSSAALVCGGAATQPSPAAAELECMPPPAVSVSNTPKAAGAAALQLGLQQVGSRTAQAATQTGTAVSAAGKPAVSGRMRQPLNIKAPASKRAASPAPPSQAAPNSSLAQFHTPEQQTLYTGTLETGSPSGIPIAEPVCRPPVMCDPTVEPVRHPAAADVATQIAASFTKQQPTPVIEPVRKVLPIKDPSGRPIELLTAAVAAASPTTAASSMFQPVPVVEPVRKVLPIKDPSGKPVELPTATTAASSMQQPMPIAEPVRKVLPIKDPSGKPVELPAAKAAAAPAAATPTAASSTQQPVPMVQPVRKVLRIKDQSGKPVELPTATTAASSMQQPMPMAEPVRKVFPIKDPSGKPVELPAAKAAAAPAVATPTAASSTQQPVPMVQPVRKVLRIKDQSGKPVELPLPAAAASPITASSIKQPVRKVLPITEPSGNPMEPGAVVATSTAGGAKQLGPATDPVRKVLVIKDPTGKPVHIPATAATAAASAAAAVAASWQTARGSSKQPVTEAVRKVLVIKDPGGKVVEPPLAAPQMIPRSTPTPHAAVPAAFQPAVATQPVRKVLPIKHPTGKLVTLPTVPQQTASPGMSAAAVPFSYTFTPTSAVASVPVGSISKALEIKPPSKVQPAAGPSQEQLTLAGPTLVEDEAFCTAAVGASTAAITLQTQQAQHSDGETHRAAGSVAEDQPAEAALPESTVAVEAQQQERGPAGGTAAAHMSRSQLAPAAASCSSADAATSASLPQSNAEATGKPDARSNLLAELGDAATTAATSVQPVATAPADTDSTSAKAVAPVDPVASSIAGADETVLPTALDSVVAAAVALHDSADGQVHEEGAASSATSVQAVAEPIGNGTTSAMHAGVASVDTSAMQLLSESTIPAVEDSSITVVPLLITATTAAATAANAADTAGAAAAAAAGHHDHYQADDSSAAAAVADAGLSSNDAAIAGTGFDNTAVFEVSGEFACTLQPVQGGAAAESKEASTALQPSAGGQEANTRAGADVDCGDNICQLAAAAEMQEGALADSAELAIAAHDPLAVAGTSPEHLLAAAAADGGDARGTELHGRLGEPGTNSDAIATESAASLPTEAVDGADAANALHYSSQAVAEQAGAVLVAFAEESLAATAAADGMPSLLELPVTSVHAPAYEASIDVVMQHAQTEAAAEGTIPAAAAAADVMLELALAANASAYSALQGAKTDSTTTEAQIPAAAVAEAAAEHSTVSEPQAVAMHLHAATLLQEDNKVLRTHSVPCSFNVPIAEPVAVPISATAAAVTTVNPGNDSQPGKGMPQDSNSNVSAGAATATAETAAAVDAFAGTAAAIPVVAPGGPQWNAAVQQLISRQGFTGQATEVKWRVILPDGDRAGPFNAQQMIAWLLHGKAPKGISKQQFSTTAADIGRLQLCGILTADYNAQRLPGAKFYKPLSQLVPAVAAGMKYAAVTKADLAKGVPAKDWNASPLPPVAAAVETAAPVAVSTAVSPAAVASSSSAAARKQPAVKVTRKQQIKQQQQQQSTAQHEQHDMDQTTSTTSISTPGAAAAAAAVPNSATWNAALHHLLSRQRFTGKDADVKWRVILSDGDRLGPYSSEQTTAWLLHGKAPKGLNKQQLRSAVDDAGSLQLCGILTADYNAQRLPGAKFYKPLSQLVPAVAAGMKYAAVTKADLAKGVPAKDWNSSQHATSAGQPAPKAAAPAAAAISLSSTNADGARAAAQQAQLQLHDQDIDRLKDSTADQPSRSNAADQSNDASWEAVWSSPHKAAAWMLQAQEQMQEEVQQQYIQQDWHHAVAEYSADVPPGFGRSSSSSSSSSSRHAKHVSATFSGTAAGRTADVGSDVPPGVGRSSSNAWGPAASSLPVQQVAAASAPPPAAATIRLLDAALLSEEQLVQRLHAALDVMQPVLSTEYLLSLDEPQLAVIARIESADLMALLGRPQPQLPLQAFISQVLLYEQSQQQLLPPPPPAAQQYGTGEVAVVQSPPPQQRQEAAPPVSEAAAAVLARDEAGVRHTIRPGDLLPEHSEALAFEFPRYFAAGWQLFARTNPRFASWDAIESDISFPEPQHASKQYFRQRRELYQACTAVLLAEQAAAKAIKGKSVTGQQSELQQLVEAALWTPPPAATARSEMLVLQDSFNSTQSTPTAAAAAATAAAAMGPQVQPAAATAPVEPPGAAYVFFGKPVCEQCGDRGHTVNNCSTAFCQRCDVYGHDARECASACERCGRVHERSDGYCRTFQCTACGLFGHRAQHCPSQQCDSCGARGHSSRHCQAHKHCPMCGEHGHVAIECPLICSRCLMPGHNVSDCMRPLCSICHQLGHASAQCLYNMDSIASTGRTSSNQQQQQPEDADYSARLETELNNAWWQDDQEYKQAAAAPYDDVPVQNESQQQQQRAPQQLRQLQLIKQHLQVEGQLVPPCELRLDAAAAFEASLPQGCLPIGWQAYDNWVDLDRAVSWANHGVAPSKLKKLYRDAKTKAGSSTHQHGSSAALQDVCSNSMAADTAWTGDTPVWPGNTSHVDSAVQPGSAAWSAALQQLLSRQDFTGKDADVKWLVIMQDGDRLGPFSKEDMVAWLLHSKAPKGVSRQHAQSIAADAGSLQLCGILTADYNAQRLPGAKFYKPLSQLVPAVAAGMKYAAVTKADLAKGVPAKDWNSNPSHAEAMPAVPAAVGSSSTQTSAFKQKQPLPQQRHRLSRMTVPDYAPTLPMSFAAAAAADVHPQPHEELLVDPRSIKPCDLSQDLVLQFNQALGSLLPYDWQLLESWGQVEGNLRRSADFWAQQQLFNSLRKKLQLAAARVKSAELAAAEEEELATVLALSEQEAARQRQREQWVEPSWVQHEQHQPIGYAAAAAREVPAAEPGAVSGVSAASARVPATASASPWDAPVDKLIAVSSAIAEDGSGAAQYGASVCPGSSSVAPPAVMLPSDVASSTAAIAGMVTGHEAAGARAWTVIDSPLPASGITGLPAAANVLASPVVTPNWHGFNAVQAALQAPGAASNMQYQQVNQAPAVMVAPHQVPWAQQHAQAVMGSAPVGMPPAFAGIWAPGVPHAGLRAPPGYAAAALGSSQTVVAPLSHGRVQQVVAGVGKSSSDDDLQELMGLLGV